MSLTVIGIHFKRSFITLCIWDLYTFTSQFTMLKMVASLSLEYLIMSLMNCVLSCVMSTLPPPWFPTQGLTDAKEEFQHWTPVDNCVSLFWREWPYIAFFYNFITLPGRCHLGISWMNYCTFSIFTWVRIWRVVSGLFFFSSFFFKASLKSPTYE